MLTLRVTLILMVMLTELYANETAQGFINKYKNYITVCRGMGYENICKGRNHGMHLRTNSFADICNADFCMGSFEFLIEIYE